MKEAAADTVCMQMKHFVCVRNLTAGSTMLAHRAECFNDVQASLKQFYYLSFHMIRNYLTSDCLWVIKPLPNVWATLVSSCHSLLFSLRNSLKDDEKRMFVVKSFIFH